MSNYLAIDTSSRYLTVLAKKGDKVSLRHLGECAMKHSVILMSEIDKALEEVSLKPEECDFFSAVTGPGSFTGIRIGVATAKGFALATGKPLKPITAFELIAYNVNSKKFCVAIDANHSHYYACGLEDGKEFLKPCYLSEEEVNNLNLPLYGFEELPLKGYTKLDVKHCLKTAVESCPNLSDGMHALYVRKSQAEEALSENKRVEI